METALNPAIPGFDLSQIKSETDHLFDQTHVFATPSTEGFREHDPEEKITQKVLARKRIFHMGRSLQIKHLPRDVSEAEILELLNDFPVTKIILSYGSGASTAKAELENTEILESWSRDRTFYLREQVVLVHPVATEMLCVANLPLEYTEDQFKSLVRSCGQVYKCFLMISEKTGDSKGYGFVEYIDMKISSSAKNTLDKKKIDGHTLLCDRLDSSLLTYESLHSKCLYIDGLPKDFCYMKEFRKIFSAIVNPPYCQIALKNGCPQNWGLVEYSNWEDAEAAQTSLNGYNLYGHNIRISYYIPGVSAINVHLQLLNGPEPKNKPSGLFPIPSDQAIKKNLQNLIRKNPIFALNIQSILISSTNINTSHMRTEPNRELPLDPQDGCWKPSPFHSGLVAELRKSPIPPLPPSQGPSPLQFPTPIKNPLLLNPPIAPPPRIHPNLRPPAEGVTPSFLSLGEKPSTYLADLLRQVHEAPPSIPISVALPPPEPASHPYKQPPPNFIGERAFRTPQNFQRIVTDFNSVRQPPFSPLAFPNQYFSPIDSSSHAPPPLAFSALTNPILRPFSPELIPVSCGNFMIPPPVSPPWSPLYLPPSSQPMFNTICSRDVIWSQALLSVSHQPNPMMTNGRKRRRPPSPESSLGDNYNGQHSRGLSGHSDSYFKKKKN